MGTSLPGPRRGSASSAIAGAASGVVVRRVVVDRGVWNQPVPVDPDEYTITAAAPDHDEWSTTIKVKTKDRVVQVPALERSKGVRKPKVKTKRVSVNCSKPTVFAPPPWKPRNAAIQFGA